MPSKRESASNKDIKKLVLKQEHKTVKLFKFECI